MFGTSFTPNKTIWVLSLFPFISKNDIIVLVEVPNLQNCHLCGLGGHSSSSTSTIQAASNSHWRKYSGRMANKSRHIKEPLCQGGSTAVWHCGETIKLNLILQHSQRQRQRWVVEVGIKEGYLCLESWSDVDPGFCNWATELGC